jgi:peptidoglycan/LPS O-acetylase OafA/YrhL
MKLSYYKELDGVRGVAALMVMFFHFSQTFETFAFFKKIAVFGQTGVSLFFVLSGFLITRILLSTKDSPNFFLNFYARRAVRIFPLYYLFLGIYYFLLPLIFNTPIPAFNLQMYHWVYLQNVAMTFNWKFEGPGHFWSLAIEEQFYLFWPCLVFFLSNRKIVILSVSIIVLAFFVRLFLVNHHYEVFYFTFCRIDELAVGALLAILEVKNKLISKNASRFLLLFVLIIIPTIIIWIFYTGLGNPILQTVKFMLLSFSYFSIIGFVISIKDIHPIKKMLEFKPLLFSGKISYGLYVYHPICFWILYRYYNTSTIVLNFILAFGVTYLIAAASYYLYEVRFLKLKRYLENKDDKLVQLQPELLHKKIN